MIDVSGKAPSTRTAVAEATISLGPKAFQALKNNSLTRKAKDTQSLFTIAEIAGMLGAKQTSNLIPMCHQIPLDFVKFKILFGDS